MRLSIKEKNMTQVSTVARQDKNLRDEIRKTYQALKFEPRFQQVDLEIFCVDWNPLKKSQSAQTEHFTEN